MTTKADYTEQEWHSLLEAPILTGTYIIISDVSMTALPREVKGMVNAMTTSPVPPAAQDLISDLVVEIQEIDDMSGRMEKAASGNGSGNDPRADVLEQIGESLAVLDVKSTPEEKLAFGGWLMQIAEATAEAGREGGFLGIGSVRVSDKEKAALARLQQLFGLV